MNLEIYTIKKKNCTSNCYEKKINNKDKNKEKRRNKLPWIYINMKNGKEIQLYRVLKVNCRVELSKLDIVQLRDCGEKAVWTYDLREIEHFICYDTW